MNKYLTKSLIAGITTVVCCGAVVGCYLGLKEQIFAAQPEPPAIPTIVTTMFPTATAATALTDTDSPYILAAYEVTLEDKSTAYAYDLESAKGFSGSLEFAIGVQDNVVVSYSFIENINEDNMGLGQAEKLTDLFVGYSLDNTDIETSMTTSHTYSGMETAVQAALEDAQAR